MSKSKELMNPDKVGMCEHGNFKDNCAACESAEKGEEQKSQEAKPAELTPEGKTLETSIKHNDSDKQEGNNLKKQQVIDAFKEMLKDFKAANNFNIIEIGLKNSAKGYSYYRDGRLSGFKEADPNSLRSKLLQVSANPELTDKFDTVMIELSELGSIPWEELQKAFEEECANRFSARN